MTFNFKDKTTKIYKNQTEDWTITCVDTGELTINHTQRHTEDYEYTIKENPITEALA